MRIVRVGPSTDGVLRRKNGRPGAVEAERDGVASTLTLLSDLGPQGTGPIRTSRSERTRRKIKDLRI